MLRASAVSLSRHILHIFPSSRAWLNGLVQQYARHLARGHAPLEAQGPPTGHFDLLVTMFWNSPKSRELVPSMSARSMSFWHSCRERSE